jgi:hypothetical protein
MTGVSVTVAVVYYMFTLRINMRTQQLALKTQELALESQKQSQETRQAQLLTDMMQAVTSREGLKGWAELMNMQWTDYEDFESKYGSDVNEDNFALRYSWGWWFDKMGFFMKNGFVKPEMIYDLDWRNGILLAWSKFRDIIAKQRIVYAQPDLWHNWEYLYNVMAKMSKERGETEYTKGSFRYADAIAGRKNVSDKE